MALTLEIAAREWPKFLDGFSKRNQGRPARLEVSTPPGEGEPVLAEHRPFLGVEYERKGNAAPSVIVTLGGISPETPRFTHIVGDPTRLWVDEDLDGLGEALEIESRVEGTTLLVFEREQVLPPRTGRPRVEAPEQEAPDLASDAAGYPEAIARERGGGALARLSAVVPYTHVHRRLRHALEAAQDIVVAGLCVVLLALMLQMLWRLGRMAIVDHAAPTVMLSQVVLVLILVELYRTLIFYLREHRIAVSLMVEVAIVSLLRELILEGLTQLTWAKAVGVSLLLLVLGGILAGDRWLSRVENGCPASSAH